MQSIVLIAIIVSFFTFVEGLDRLDLLHKRYMIFSWMLGIDKVSYVASTNIVKAPDDVWNSILEVLLFCKKLICCMWEYLTVECLFMMTSFSLFNRAGRTICMLIWYVVNRNSKSFL